MVVRGRKQHSSSSGSMNPQRGWIDDNNSGRSKTKEGRTIEKETGREGSRLQSTLRLPLPSYRWLVSVDG